MTKPFAFRDLPADCFPFKVEFINKHDLVIHTIDVSGPGAMEVPGLSPLWGKVAVRVTFANGKVAFTPA